MKNGLDMKVHEAEDGVLDAGPVRWLDGSIGKVLQSGLNDLHLMKIITKIPVCLEHEVLTHLLSFYVWNPSHYHCS